jgi:hypothetical protein
VERLYGVIEEVLEEDGKSAATTIIMTDWNSLVGHKAYGNIVGPHGLGRRIRDVKCLLIGERSGLVI